MITCINMLLYTLISLEMVIFVYYIALSTDRFASFKQDIVNICKAFKIQSTLDVSNSDISNFSKI